MRTFTVILRLKMLLNYNPRACLPSAEDLHNSDDTPLDAREQVNHANLTIQRLEEKLLELGINPAQL